MIYLENHLLKVAIRPKGAELTSIVRKDTGLEYMWNADPAFWPKSSPILFPIIGNLKKHEYQYNDKTYTLSTRHGFARDLDTWTVSDQTADSATFSITDTPATLEVYPFHFTCAVKYQLKEATVLVTYEVKNEGEANMLFSVGGHPAFSVPVAPGTSYDDYYLQFEKIENAGSWLLSSDGFVENATRPLLENTDTLPLSKSLFYNDALILKDLASSTVSLRSKATPHGVDFSFEGFPYLGIWAAKDADFVCIEPWCGIADTVYASGNLFEKEGINNLAPKATFSRTWSVSLF